MGLPQLDEIDPWMVDDDWTNCLLVAVRSPIERSHFVVVGDNLISEASQLLAGAPVALCPRDTLAGVLLSLLPQVLSARRCLIAEGRGEASGCGHSLSQRAAATVGERRRHRPRAGRGEPSRAAAGRGAGAADPAHLGASG